NVFFGTSKRYFGTEFRTVWINGMIMVGFLALIITALEISLRRQLTRV
ncbi:MAG: ABC-type multidrug transport system, ATPase component, partial [Verrucomicrobiaceae bacterium]|nr:ABC-type multidrug transport system, ATPase component [Verrucomicrobiaceae bacterium]